MLKFFVALAVVHDGEPGELGWRVGIVVAAAVPLTLAAVFVIMLATGRDFDRITLGALILALGLLVDDAIIAIEMMVVKMEEGMDRIEGCGLCLEPYRGPHAVGHAGHHHRLHAGRLRAIHGGGICRQYLLDRRLRADRLLDRRRGLHALSRREAVAGDQDRWKAATSDLQHAALSTAAPAHRLVPCAASSTVAGVVRAACSWSPCSAWGGQETVLPEFRPAGSARRGADAGGPSIEATSAAVAKRRSLAAPAAGGQDRHRLYRPRRAAFLSGLQSRAARLRPSPRSSC